MPTIEKLAGFVSYHALRAGERLFYSVTILENRGGAAESNRLAAESRHTGGASDAAKVLLNVGHDG